MPLQVVVTDALDIINQTLKSAKELGASDIHIKSDLVPQARINGQLQKISGGKPMSAFLLLEFVANTCPAGFLSKWKADNQVDYAYAPQGVGRYRVSAFYQRGAPSVVLRHVKEECPTFESLNLDPVLFKSLCGLNDGIVLLCGPTGSGKSSTLAAMLQYINRTFSAHIITLEDPIEFSYPDEKSVFNQREVGIDTPSFSEGLKVALRQDPDIILVGEMRDRETFETALRAAETGHLVFGTIHSSNAQQAVQRLFEFFAPSEQASRRRQIAGSLRATINQRLLPAVGGSRVPVLEVFRVDVLGRKIIESGEFEKIGAVIDAGKENGSLSFNADLYRLIQKGLITKAVGIDASPNPKALEMNLKGIFLSEGGIIA